MNILLITKIYPSYLDQSRMEISYAVHYFAKEWAKTNNIQVIRLCTTYSKIFRIFNRFRLKKVIKTSQDRFVLDGVNIKRHLIKKTPGLDYDKFQIKKISKRIINNIDNESTPDIIICDILNPSIYLGVILAKRFGCKLVASLHNSDIFYLKEKKYYQKFIEIDSYIDKIVFRSDNVENQFLELYKGRKTKKEFAKVLFGVDLKDLITKDKFELKLSKKMTEIIVACSLRKLKNVNILIESFSKLDNFENYVLRIIGDGPERKNLEELAKSLGCGNSVIFEGSKEHNEVLAYMENADIFAMVSSPETFGLVYIEAMAKGCITIGSKDEGIDGVIVNNENGFLCNPHSSSELKLLLEDILKMNSEDKSRIMSSARETVISMTHDKLAESFLHKIK